MTLRIGYLVDRYVQPSQTFVVEEVRELRAGGDHVVVVALRHGPSTPPETLVVTALTAGRATVLREHVRWALRRPGGYVSFVRGRRLVRSELSPAPAGVPYRRLPLVATLLRDQGVDRLHAHFAWGGAAAALLLSRLTGWPWSVTLHANDVFAARRNLTPKLAEASALVTVCDYNLAFLRDELGLHRPVTVVPCGVQPVPPAPRQRSATVVAVGRLVPKKGFDVLLDATALLRHEVPTARVVVVGDGPLREDLERQAVALGVDDLVTFTGSLEHAATLRTIADADVLCLPARIAADGDRDSMPVVVKEALARGVPAVVTDVVAMREMVDDDVGRVVGVDDPTDLARALAEVLGLPDEAYGRLSRQAGQRVAERFALGPLVARLRAEVLAAHTSPTRGRSSGA